MLLGTIMGDVAQIPGSSVQKKPGLPALWKAAGNRRAGPLGSSLPLWALGRQRVQGKDLGLAMKASLSRNPKHLSPSALARRSNFFFYLCPQGTERDRDCLGGPAGLGVAFEPGFLTEWPLPRHRELRVRLLAASSLVSGLGGRWGTACAPQAPGGLPWVGWCRCRLQ